MFNNNQNYSILLILLKIKKQNGFTLIELLIVILILSILYLVSLPTFMGQVGKSRELEAKSNLGAIARSQQAYHFEKQIFATTLNELNLDFDFTSKYYNFPSASVGNTTIVKHQAIPKNPDIDQVKNYAVGVYYDDALFQISFCQAYNLNQPVDVGNTPSGDCTNNGIKLR
ncbi:MAG: hypothetical protein Kow0049_34150 [Stanieria sp.]